MQGLQNIDGKMECENIARDQRPEMKFRNYGIVPRNRVDHFDAHHHRYDRNVVSRRRHQRRFNTFYLYVAYAAMHQLAHRPSNWETSQRACKLLHNKLQITRSFRLIAVCAELYSYHKQTGFYTTTSITHFIRITVVTSQLSPYSWPSPSLLFRIFCRTVGQ